MIETRIETKEYLSHSIDTKTFNSIPELIKYWIFILKDRTVERRLRDGFISEEEYEEEYTFLRIEIREMINQALLGNIKELEAEE